MFAPNVYLLDEPGVYADGKGSSSLANPADGWGTFIAGGASGEEAPKVHTGNLYVWGCLSLRPHVVVSPPMSIPNVEVYVISFRRSLNKLKYEG